MIKALRLAFVTLLLLLHTESVLAQHNHGRRNVVEIEYDTVPQHDEVLPEAPDDLLLRFNDYVRLIKLTLKKNDMEPLDIGFQFDPIGNRVFIQELPPLEEADYYTAEWAVLNAENIMVYGFFCFSFGPNAEIPTTIIDSRQLPSSPVFGDKNQS